LPPQAHPQLFPQQETPAPNTPAPNTAVPSTAVPNAVAPDTAPVEIETTATVDPPMDFDVLPQELPETAEELSWSSTAQESPWAQVTSPPTPPAQPLFDAGGGAPSRNGAVPPEESHD
jgi:hypothetical protein